MKLKQWIDPKGVQYWVKDKNGVARQMVFGARKNLNSKLQLMDYMIQTTRRSKEWIEKNYGMRS